MANLGIQINSSDVPVKTLIPKGDYPLRICDSEVKATAAGTGTILLLTIEIIDGQHAGRKVFDQINLTNPNEIAVTIGRERLGAYCHALGVAVLNDSQQLHNIPFTGRIIIKEDKSGDYDDRNEVRSIKAIQGGQAQGQQQGGFNPQGQPQGFQNQGQGGFQNASQGFNQGGFQNQGQPQGNPQGFVEQGQGGHAQQGQGYWQFASNQGQPQGNQGFQQGGYAQNGGQPANTAQQPGGTYSNDPQPNQVQGQPVDNSAVPPMNPVQNQGQPQGNPQGQQAQGQKAPWENG